MERIGEFLRLTADDDFNTYNGFRFVRGATWKTKGVCKGRCSGFPGISKGRRKDQNKYCSRCEYHIKSNNLCCDCCKAKYRTRRNNPGNKSRIMMKQLVRY